MCPILLFLSSYALQGVDTVFELLFARTPCFEGPGPDLTHSRLTRQNVKSPSRLATGLHLKIRSTWAQDIVESGAKSKTYQINLRILLMLCHCKKVFDISFNVGFHQGFKFFPARLWNQSTKEDIFSVFVSCCEIPSDLSDCGSWTAELRLVDCWADLTKMGKDEESGRWGIR